MEKNLFLDKLKKIEYQYQEEQSTHKSFNIFSALHIIEDERRLHSRFIAYLLSPKSKHGMGDAFLKKFVAIIPQLKDFDSGNEIIILPNEDERSEKDDIDILIRNQEKNQAIIIENKINAGDSNHDGKPQMLIYFDKMKKKLGYENQEEEAIKNIKLVYVTLDRHEPSLYEEFKKRNIIPTLIDYRNEIKQWLEDCIDDKFINDFFKEILRQYLNVTIQLTNDLKRATELKDLISDNIDLALEKEKTCGKISEFGDFIHVKWHTVFDFWNELTSELEKRSKVKIIARITTDEITKQTHKDSKKPYGILIEVDDNQLYIMNDAKNGLTLGFSSIPLSKEAKKRNQNWCKINEDIKFSKFSDEVTFMIINESNRKELIVETIGKIKEFTGKNLNNEE